MTTTFVFSALFVGGAALSFPLLKWGQRLRSGTLDNIQDVLFLPLIAVVAWLLFVLYPPGHAFLLMMVMVFMPLAASIKIFDFLGSPKNSPKFLFNHFIAIGVIIGILVSENALVVGSSYPPPELSAWIGGKRALPVLVAALNDGDNKVVESAVFALGNIGDKSAAPALIDVLKNNDGDVCQRAAWALGEIGDSSAVPALVQAFKDKDGDVRKEAAKALITIGSEAGTPMNIDKLTVPALTLTLTQVLVDSDESLRYGAVAALVKIGRPAVPALTGALKDEILKGGALKDNKEYVCWLTAEALVQIGDKSAVPALISADRVYHYTHYPNCIFCTAIYKLEAK